MCSWKLGGWNQTIIAHQNELTIIAYYGTQQSSFHQESCLFPIVPKNFWPPWLQKYNCLCNWSLTPEDNNFTKESLFPSDTYLKNRGMCIPVSGTKTGITYCSVCAIHLEIKVWYLEDLMKESCLLQNRGPDRMKAWKRVVHRRAWWTWESSA